MLLHQNERDYDFFLENNGKEKVLNIISFLRQLKTTQPYEDIPQTSVKGFSSSDIYKILDTLTLFYGISPVQYGQNGDFKITSTLTREIEGFEGALQKNAAFLPYLDLRENIFFYHNNKLDIDPSGYVYVILKTIYENFNGRSGQISYKDLGKKLAALPKFKRKSQKTIENLVRKYTTSNTEGLGVIINRRKRQNPTEQNGRRLVGVIRGVGIYFNNGDEKPVSN